MGYAFINFIDTKYIRMFYEDFNGKRWEKFNSDKVESYSLDDSFYRFAF